MDIRNELIIKAAMAGISSDDLKSSIHELIGGVDSVPDDTVLKVIDLPYNKFGKLVRCVAPFYAVGLFDESAIRSIMNKAAYNEDKIVCSSAEDYIKLAEVLLNGYPSLSREIASNDSPIMWAGFEDEPLASKLLNVAEDKGVVIQETEFKPPFNSKFDIAIGYLYPGCGCHSRNAIYKAAAMILHPTSNEDWEEKFTKLLRGDFGV